MSFKTVEGRVLNDPMINASIIDASIQRGTEYLINGKPVLLQLRDFTIDGRAHLVQAYIDARANYAVVEKPEDGTVYTTMLHAISAAAEFSKRASLVYPELFFAEAEKFGEIENLLLSEQVLDLPLVLHSHTADMIMMHKQDRRISPMHVAHKYYEAVKISSSHNWPNHIHIRYAKGVHYVQGNALTKGSVDILVGVPDQAWDGYNLVHYHRLSGLMDRHW